jgi:hypothetical protein
MTRASRHDGFGVDCLPQLHQRNEQRDTKSSVNIVQTLTKTIAYRFRRRPHVATSNFVSSRPEFRVILGRFGAPA